MQVLGQRPADCVLEKEFLRHWQTQYNQKKERRYTALLPLEWEDLVNMTYQKIFASYAYRDFEG